MRAGGDLLPHNGGASGAPSTAQTHSTAQHSTSERLHSMAPAQVWLKSSSRLATGGVSTTDKGWGTTDKRARSPHSSDRRRGRWAGIRVGEARKPGPWQVCAANATSVPRNEEALVRLGEGADLIGITETRLGELQQRSYARRLAQRGFTAVWGKPQPLQRQRSRRRFSSWAVRAGGVGVMVRQGTPVRAAPRDSPRRRELWESGRWLHALVGTGRGREVVNVIVYYGISGAANSPEAMAENERLLALVLEDAALLAGTPTLLLGDFNVPPDRSAVLGAALGGGGWVDLHHAWATLQGETPAATCFAQPTKSAGTRIDLILANAAAAPALTGVRVVEETGLPTHRPLMAGLEWEAFTGRVWRDRKPAAFAPREDAAPASRDPKAEKAEQEAREAVAQESRTPFEADWATAVRSGGVEPLWQA